jgi:hypothetical protein
MTGGWGLLNGCRRKLLLPKQISMTLEETIGFESMPGVEITMYKLTSGYPSPCYAFGRVTAFSNSATGKTDV